MTVATIVQAIVDAITGFLGGFGESINTFFSDIFTVSAGEGTTSISTLGVFLLCMIGVGFGCWLVNKLISIVRG